MFDTENTTMILGAIMLGLAVHALMYAAQPAIMAEMFPTRMRYSGVSLGYQATALVAGSWAPLIGTALLRAYEAWLPIAVYILFAAAVSLAAALYMRETRGTSLLALDQEDAARRRV
jgi:MFS family permease